MQWFLKRAGKSVRSKSQSASTTEKSSKGVQEFSEDGPKLETVLPRKVNIIFNNMNVSSSILLLIRDKNRLELLLKNPRMLLIARYWISCNHFHVYSILYLLGCEAEGWISSCCEDLCS